MAFPRGFEPRSAVWETLVHLGREDLLPSFVYFEIEIDGALIDESLVAVDKMTMPEHESQSYGEQWVMRNEYPALLVPSAIVPTERNLLLNPANPDFKKNSDSWSLRFLDGCATFAVGNKEIF